MLLINKNLGFQEDITKENLKFFILQQNISAQIQKIIMNNDSLYKIMTLLNEAINLIFNVLEVDISIFLNNENTDHQIIFNSINVNF